MKPIEECKTVADFIGGYASVSPEALYDMSHRLCWELEARHGGQWHVQVYPHDILRAYCVSITLDSESETLLLAPTQDLSKPPQVERVVAGWSVTEPTTIVAFIRRCMMMGVRRATVSQQP